MDANGFWVIVGSPDNFAKTKEHGFSIQGIKSRHRKNEKRRDDIAEGKGGFDERCHTEPRTPNPDYRLLLTAPMKPTGSPLFIAGVPTT